MAKRHRQVIVDYADIHFPHHDEGALEVLEKTIAYIKPDVAVCMGDLMCCDAMTPRELQDAINAPKDWVIEELEPALDHLKSVAGNSGRVVFGEGNHEHRVEETLANGGKLAKNIRKLISPRHILPAAIKGLTYVPYSGQSLSANYFISDSLMTTHGWTHCKHAAQKHLEKAHGKSVLFHHTHRRQMATTRDPWTGIPVTASSAGCLCDLQQHYIVGGDPTEWSHGFHIVIVEGDRHWIYPVSIINGYAILPDGKEIRA